MKSIVIMQTDSVYRNGIVDNGQCDCDCDCACTYTPSVNIEANNLKGMLYIKASGVRTFPLHSEWRGLYNPVGTKPLIVLNQHAYKRWERFPKSQKIDPLSLDSENFDFFSSMIPTELFQPESVPCKSQPNNNNWQLTSWLHLTDRCNLRCAYCYLPHASKDMSPKTGRLAVEATFRSALLNNFRQIRFKYAGGEPLLRLPLILELHSYARQLADKYAIQRASKYGRQLNDEDLIGLKGVVLSNGTLLTKKMVKALVSLKLELMISMDGIGQYHNQHRYYPNHRGSFGDVIKAIDLALTNGITPSISITVSNRNAEGLQSIIAWILKQGLPFSINFYRENDLSTPHKDMQLNEKKIINGMLAAFSVLENNLPRHNFLGGLLDRTNLSLPHTHTCGVGQNYLVIAQNGQIAKCQMQIDNPITDTSVSDPIAVIRADNIGIQNISVEEKEDCKTCEWKYWCSGGCPLEAYRTTERYNVKSPNCNIYKTLLPEALRLEGARLLKYKNDSNVVKKILV
jgi:uncharacterized protein